MIDYIIEYQIDRFFVWLIYSIVLWIFSRFWFNNFSQKQQIIQVESFIPPSISAERFKSEQLMNENHRLKTEIEQFKVDNERLKVEIEQLKTDLDKWQKLARREVETIKSLKAQNEDLSEALNKANKQQETDFEEKSEKVTTTDEFDTMVQVMKGRPLIKNQAVQKAKGTEIFNKLIDRTEAYKQQVEAALNDMEQADCENTAIDLTNFDIRKYV